jgi:cytoskeletal protein RodZ
MGFIDNKYVAKFISGGAAPPLPPSHKPATTPSTSSHPSSSHPPFEPSTSYPLASTTQLPTGWIAQWDPNTQQVYYLEQASGLTQWVPPATAPSDLASTFRGETMTNLALRQHDVIRRNHVYLNLPTASERAEITRKAEEKREREGPPKYVMLVL